MKWLAALLLIASAAVAQTLSGHALVEALQKGGYVIVMRHAASPREVPAKPNSDNTKPERQLDAEGIQTATEMGQAIRALKIPIGDVYSSPTYRARETVKYAQLGNATSSNLKAIDELGDNGRSMSGGTAAQAEWLKKKVAEGAKGTNIVLVTHMPNLTGAFPQEAQGVADGEALIFGPGSKLVARVKIEEWARLK